MSDTVKITSQTVAPVLTLTSPVAERPSEEPPSTPTFKPEQILAFKQNILAENPTELLRQATLLFDLSANITIHLGKAGLEIPQDIQGFILASLEQRPVMIRPLTASQHIMSHLISERSLAIYIRLVERADHEFAHELIPELGRQGLIALKMCDDDNGDIAVQLAMETISAASERAVKTFQGLKDITVDLEKALNLATQWYHIDDHIAGRWRNALLTGRGIVHDSNNTLTMAVGGSDHIIAQIDGGAPVSNLKEDIRIFEKFHFTNTRGAIDLAYALQKKKAVKKGVEVNFTGSIKGSLPENARTDFYRIAYELIYNSIKYSDGNKKTHFLRINSKEMANRNLITFTDNGVGISDIDKALQLGVRLNPELAPGTGTGLPTIVALANKHGWSVMIESQVGIGTKVSVEMPIYSETQDIGSSGEPLLPVVESPNSSSQSFTMQTSYDLPFTGAQQVFIPPTLAFMPVI